MKHPLLLLLVLLGTVAALHLENDAPHLEIQEPEADLGQDLDGSGDQEGELALTEDVIKSEREEVETSACQDTFEDEEAMESDPDALDEDLECPKEEDTVQVQGSPGCKTCHYLLVRTPKTFKRAQNVCRKCYKGNLVSIHSYSLNSQILYFTRRLNQAQVWIGGFIRHWWLCRRYRWTDGSRWNFAYWAAGQPRKGRGRCIALCTKGGHWRRAPCRRRLPFICSA
uniref:Proteoglycan 3, pro eosinophil major basic protein 2 n=1 Tax=Prolemur simus TaxID=1328070 RepID=A0A8C8Z5B0_PROSS